MIPHFSFGRASEYSDVPFSRAILNASSPRRNSEASSSVRSRRKRSIPSAYGTRACRSDGSGCGRSSVPSCRGTRSPWSRSPPTSWGDVNHVVSADETHIHLPLGLIVLHLLRVPEDEVHVRVESIEDPTVSAPAFQLNHHVRADPLVEERKRLNHGDHVAAMEARYLKVYGWREPRASASRPLPFDGSTRNPESRAGGEVRVQARSCRPRVDPREHPDVAFASEDRDFFDNADRRPRDVPSTVRGHWVHPPAPFLGSIPVRRYILNRLVLSTRFSAANRIEGLRTYPAASHENRRDLEETHVLVHEGAPRGDPQPGPRRHVRQDGRGPVDRGGQGRRDVQWRIAPRTRRPHPEDRTIDDRFREDVVAAARTHRHPDHAHERRPHHGAEQVPRAAIAAAGGHPDPAEHPPGLPAEPDGGRPPGPLPRGPEDPLRDPGDRGDAGEEHRGDRVDRRHAEVLRRGDVPPGVHPESGRRHPRARRRRPRGGVHEARGGAQRMAGEYPPRGEGHRDGTGRPCEASRRAGVEGRRTRNQRRRHDLPGRHAVRPRGERVPGFRGLLEATGINAAEAMVEYAVQKAKAGSPKRP